MRVEVRPWCAFRQRWFGFGDQLVELEVMVLKEDELDEVSLLGWSCGSGGFSLFVAFLLGSSLCLGGARMVAERDLGGSLQHGIHGRPVVIFFFYLGCSCLFTPSLLSPLLLLAEAMLIFGDGVETG